MRCNGIEHLRSTPYHPSSNGLAERAVQTVKTGVHKLVGTLEVRLSRFLFKYRVTPQATTGIAPAELLIGRRLRTHLDLLYPTVKERVQRRQRHQKENRERHRELFRFILGIESWVEILQQVHAGCQALYLSARETRQFRSKWMIGEFGDVIWTT